MRALPKSHSGSSRQYSTSCLRVGYSNPSDIGPAESESAKRYLLLLSPLRHMATLDLSDRSIRLGFSTRGLALRSGYHEADWSTAMLADAVREVRRIDAKRVP